MKINAIIEKRDGGTLVLDFPRSIYDVYEKLQSVGIRQSPHQITLSDEEDDDVRIKLYLGTQIANTIFDAILQWFYEIIYGAVADFFTMMGNMGAEIFDLSWVQATIRLFTLFGWSLFVAGTVVAIFDVQ